MGIIPSPSTQNQSFRSTDLPSSPSLGSEHYLEPIAKSYREIEGDPRLVGKNVGKCGYWAIVGKCGNGHFVAKELGCGREWCPRCREEFHRRRMARWLPKLQQVREMGYLVITFPSEFRKYFKSAYWLRKFRRSVVRMLKGMMFKRGVSRWHWFGDPKEGEDPPEFHPHLNILVDHGYIPRSGLEEIRKRIQKRVEVFVGREVEVVVVHYQYTRSIRKMLHWLKYVTRPTFLDYNWCPLLAEELYRFNNSHWWGKWDGDPVWGFGGDLEQFEEIQELDAVEKIERGICPVCGSKIEWGWAIEEALVLEFRGFEGVGAGYWVRGRGG